MGNFHNLLFYILIYVTIIRTDDNREETQCYECSSADGGINCVNKPSPDVLETCAKADDTCGIIIRGTTTMRGCSSVIGDGDLSADPCKESKCNDGLFPATRLKCYQCENCMSAPEDTALLPCRNFEAADECYTDVISNETIFRGCMSDKPSQLTEFVQKCNTTGCNNQEAIETLTCTQCKSEEDDDCIKIDDADTCEISNQKECGISTLLGRPKKASCFTYVKEGKVERGCVEKTSDPKPDDEYYQYCSDYDKCNRNCFRSIKCLQCSPEDEDCATATGLESVDCPNEFVCSVCKDDRNVSRSCGVQNQGTCAICHNKDGCNSQKLRQCYNCSSILKENCATWKTPNRISLETCSDENEVCATYLVNRSRIERGCRLPEAALCKDNDPTCKTCDEDRCNDESFPKGMQRCVQCSGRNCRMQISPQVAFECDLYVPDDFCYTYVDENDVAHRGCASTTNGYAQCTATGNCWVCKAQACNTPKLQICYKCTSDINGTCANWKDPSEIISKMCKSPDEVCATVITGDTVERGCKMPETVECAEGDPSCQKCSGFRDNCNQGAVIKRPRRCVRCSGTAECINEQEQNIAVYCSNYVKDDGCYVYADKRGRVVRGCLSDEIEYQDCKDATDDGCWACYADSCNTAKLQTCYHCSSAMNDTCASWQDPTAIKSKACQSPDEVCVTIVKGNEVERGCKLQEMVDCDEGDPSCQKCSDRDNCNEGIVTKRPKRCVQCSGNADCIGQQDKSKAVFCKEYAEDDGCYVYANEAGQVFRGCLSEEDEYRKCNESTSNNCWTCNTDACNTEKVLQCYHCLSHIKEACGTWKEPLAVASAICRRPDEVCATAVTGDIVERGCKSLGKVDCAPRDPSCQKCDDGDNCNKGAVTKRPRRCVRCSGINDCPKEQDKNRADFCDTYSENDGCYVYAYKDGQVFRGCLSNVEEYQKCNETTNNHCWTCTTDTCNTPKLFKCYSCSSDINGTCASWTEPGAITSETCLSPNEVCATVIKGGTIERGCKLPASCKSGDPSCQNCNDRDNCNEGPGLKRAERCVTCSGTADCVKEQEKNSSMLCERHEENYGCFVYADKDGQAYRGCLSDAEAYQKCNDSTNNQCWTCTSDGCNTPPLRLCYSCSSGIDGNCATWTNPASIASITCRSPDEACTAVVTGSIAERGCLPPDRAQCLAGDPSCKKCTDWDNCNEGQLQMRPRRCLQCASTSDCIKEQDKNSAMFCDKYAENDGCFVYSNENNEVLRGCVSSTEEYNKCQKDTNGNCWTCRQDSCNNIKMPRCYTCSSKLDDNCATAKNISSIPSQICQSPSDHCVSRLVNGTVVQRGCQPVTEIDPDCGFNSGNCRICEDKDNCNADPLPRKRIACIECSGTDECRTGQTPSAKTCSTYESCYIYRNTSGKGFRGCIATAEDFAKCVKESNWHCWTCKGDQCNTAKLRQCYTCESDISGNCATFENVSQIPLETCRFPEEVCAAVRIGNSVQRGCQLPESLSCSSGDPMCRSCIGDNCNDDSLATYPRKCVICSGTDDCSKEFTQDQTKYCDKYMKDDGCFAYTSTAGKVHRGCISNTAEYDKCQNSTGGHCKTCSEDGCNSKKVLRCLSCKSVLAGNCATLRDILSVQSKACRDPFERCISQIVDNAAERGCYSEAELPAGCGFNSPNCKTCDQDNCNDEFMPRKQIKCVQCEDCRDEQDPENAATCTTYESCVVSKNAIGKITRGCVSKLEDIANCIKAGDGFCWTCTGNTCNTPKVRSCYTCESDINENCANWTNPTLIRSQTCQNPDEICATITIGKKVQRKCAKPENVNCAPGDATCQKCDTDDCNKGLVHENPKRCHRCSGTGYCRLKQVAGNEQNCDVYGQPDACYAYTDVNGQVFRGCMSSRDEYENCKKAGHGKCWTCATDGCNKDQILECFTCTTATNANCGIWNVTTGMMTKLCQNPDEICSAHWKEEETIRDCSLSDEYCLPIHPFCYNCKEDKCNSGSIPKVQLKCHKCSNSTECQEEQNDTSLTLCYTSETNPSCWAYSDINGKMIRGCTGDKAGFVNCQDSGICRTCNSDGCNNFPYLASQTLQCYKCSDSEACGWGQSDGTISSCTNKITYHSTPSCIWRWRDNIFERGCTFDLGTCQGSQTFCEMCNTTAACNNGNIVTQSCVQCKSTDDPACAETAEGIGGKECSATFTTFNDRGCYTRIVGKDVDRGCAVDLSAVDLKSCKDDKDHKYCEYCDSQDCNNKKAPSGTPAAVALSTSALVLIAIIHISI